ncbi:DUF5819 family protein [Streptomyces sp. NPDC015131]|uniref:DUF5819 family protein n=1 Tax=Streptomyces sp. NPDC015131 TaxID=3364941 RepID=UPI0036FF3683
MDSYDKEAGGRAQRATDAEGPGPVTPPSVPGPAPVAGPERPAEPVPEPCADRVTPPPSPPHATTAATPGPPHATTTGTPGGPPHAPPVGTRPAPTAGAAALSLPYQVVAAVALAVIAVFACVHLAMAFLHVAPSNTLTKQHGEAVDDWVLPEFEQNWKLFAPNPLQQNIAVHVRAEVVGEDGARRTTGWIDMSAEDGEAIRGNLLPSHVNQNELRRGWDFYVNSHSDDNRPYGMRGQLSERYVRRIAMLRLEGHRLDGRIERIQLRSATRGVEAPVWSDEKTDTRTYYRVLPWWSVTAADLPGGVSGGRTEADQ